MDEVEKYFIRKIIRLKIALLVVFMIATLGIIYFVSSEASKPYFGKPQQLNSQLLKLEIENASLLKLIDSLETSNSILMQESSDPSGIFYEVQIGVFKNFDIEKYNKNLQKLHYTTISGINYITLGKFRDFDDAKDFALDMRRIGIKDAFIVSKLDGKRVDSYLLD